MGTNYYIAENHCGCCNRKDLIHIGKSSVGWAFNFRGHRNTYGEISVDNFSRGTIPYPYDVDLISWENYKQVLKDKTIINEYDDIISYDDFVTMIETYKSPNYVDSQGRKNKDHIISILEDERYYPVHSEYKDLSKHWHDNLGYSFSSIDFS